MEQIYILKKLCIQTFTHKIDSDHVTGHYMQAPVIPYGHQITSSFKYNNPTSG